MRGFEQPINVIFVLFISVAVAASVIALSVNLIRNAHDASGSLAPEDGDLDGRVIEVNRISERGAQGIAQSCFETGYRNAYLDDHTCTIIRLGELQNPTDLFDESGTYEGMTYAIEREDASCRSLFIEYVPLLDAGTREPGIKVSC